MNSWCIYLNNNNHSVYLIGSNLIEEDSVKIFSHLNQDYITLFTFKGIFMKRLSSVIKGICTKSSMRIPYDNMNGKFDCIAFANFLNYGVAYSHFIKKRNMMRSAGFQVLAVIGITGRR